MDTPTTPHTDPALDEIVDGGKAPTTVEEPPSAVEPVKVEPLPVSHPKFKTREEQAEEWQAKTEVAVEDALLGLTTRVAGLDLHPFSAARGSILRRTGNEFVQGVDLSDIEDPFLAVGRFLVIIEASLKEARLYAKDHEAGGDSLDDRAYEVMDTLPLGDIGDTVKEINDYVKSQMNTQVHGSVPEADSESAAPEAPKN